ncbi:hypothetical protein ACFCW7_23225 [Paenibacillus glucanolyticus]|uniref:hypothetical protein n=1 Tax=Paenibacillus glucanolyticus TaxID=59843 RepID=UPI0035D8BDB4
MSQDSVKKPKQMTKTIGGIDFTFQFPGVRKVIQMSDQSKDRHGNLMSEPYYGQIMDHVIVQPKTSWDYWDDHQDIMEEVFGTAIRFLNGVG